MSIIQPDKHGLPLSPVVFGGMTMAYTPEKHDDFVDRLFNDSIVEKPGVAITKGHLDNISVAHWYCNSPIVAGIKEQARTSMCGHYNPIIDGNLPKTHSAWRCRGYQYCGNTYVEGKHPLIKPEMAKSEKYKKELRSNPLEPPIGTAST